MRNEPISSGTCLAMFPMPWGTTNPYSANNPRIYCCVPQITLSLDLGEDRICSSRSTQRGGNIRVPVGDVFAIAGNGNAMNAGQTVGGRYHNRLAKPVGVVPGIGPSGASRIEDRLHGGIHRRRQRNDGAGVEIPIGLFIQALANAGRE